MSSKTPTKAAKSKKRTTKSVVSLKVSQPAMKKKRASTSSKQPSVQARPAYVGEMPTLVLSTQALQAWQKAEKNAQAKQGFEDVRSRVLTETIRALQSAEKSAQATTSSARGARRDLTSAPTSSRRGLYDGITIESTATSDSSAGSVHTLSGSSRSQEPENVEPEQQTSVKLRVGQTYPQLSDTSSLSERRSFAASFLKGFVITVGVVAFFAVLVTLLSKAS